MAQIDLADLSDWPTEKTKLQSNLDELYGMPHHTALADLSEDATHQVVTDAEKDAWTAKAEKLRPEIVAATAKEFTLAELSGAFITNEGQVAATSIAHTSVALVAGLEWSVLITETLNPGVYWQYTVPLGHSILYNGEMGTNNGSIRFTAPFMGDIAHFKTITINGGVIVVCESSAMTLTVT